jgi:hypothetical protein
MNSKTLGTNISAVEVSLVTWQGLWLLVRDREYFLPDDEYPWFRNARIAEIMNVQLLHGHHLRWPDLDVDLDLESLEKPQQFPLIYQE